MNQHSSKIFYWAPFIDQIATIRAVINSAHSLKKFSKNKTPYIIDVFGEWLPYYEEINDKKVNIKPKLKVKKPIIIEDLEV